MQLNSRAAQGCTRLIAHARRLRIEIHRAASGTLLVDCGVHAAGGLAAGCRLAEICMAELGAVTLVPGHVESSSPAARGPAIQVHTDHPVAACMASQYAGWKLEGERFFGMGSGPMRAAAATEPLFETIGLNESPDECVGVVEAGELPPDDVCVQIAAACGVEPSRLTLLVAPTRSLAGTIQIVARSVETTLHKLHELQFDLASVVTGHGIAPLPPPAADDMAAIGRTNDAILYGGRVVLWLEADDETLLEVGPQTPSSASHDFGRPFAELFAEYEYDFYKIDPMLFSPAAVVLINLRSGRSHAFGEVCPHILERSFGLI